MSESLYDEIPVVTKDDLNRLRSIKTILGNFHFDGFDIEIAYSTPSGGISKDSLGTKYRLYASIYKGDEYITTYSSFTANHKLMDICKKSKNAKELAKYSLEDYLMSGEPQDIKIEPEEEPNKTAVSYIKKKGLEKKDDLCKLLKELDAYSPNPIKRRLSSITIEKELKKSEGIVDGNGLTALWMFGTFYVYAVPEEVFKENEFGSSDNEKYFKYKTNNGDYEYLVVVLV